MLDADTLSSEIVGSMFFSLKHLVEVGSKIGGRYYWQNLYGAPKTSSNDAASKMNENPECASAWMGRILMHIECFESPHPERKV